MYRPNLIRRSRLAAPAALAATALLVAACSSAGGGATTVPSITGGTEPPATMAESSPEATQAGQAYEVDLANDKDLGKFLTGEDGKTLYLFTPDTATTSNCNTGCIESWPAFTLEAGETVKGGAGVTGTFGTITRQDGSMQVTYAGHPLYYYGADQAAGDVMGQGLFSKWYVVGADGKSITVKPKASGGKYGY